MSEDKSKQAEEETDPECSCKDTCPFDCKGGCGCEACRLAYLDYMSSRHD